MAMVLFLRCLRPSSLPGPTLVIRKLEARGASPTLPLGSVWCSCNLPYICSDHPRPGHNLNEGSCLHTIAA